MSKKLHEIHWSFTSSLGSVGLERYRTAYDGDIYEVSGLENLDFTYRKIGHVKLSILHIGLAIGNHYDIREIKKVDADINQIIDSIYDFELYEIKEDIQAFYKGEFLGFDICIVEEVALIPSHRSKGIGKIVMKDIGHRFHSVTLVIAKSLPLQFKKATDLIAGHEDYNNEEKAPKELTDWERQLDFDSLEADEEKAFYQLKAFYQSIGFDHINGREELMFYNPITDNPKMEAIQFNL